MSALSLIPQLPMSALQQGQWLMTSLQQVNNAHAWLLVVCPYTWQTFPGLEVRSSAGTSKGGPYSNLLQFP